MNVVMVTVCIREKDMTLRIGDRDLMALKLVRFNPPSPPFVMIAPASGFEHGTLFSGLLRSDLSEKSAWRAILHDF